MNNWLMGVVARRSAEVASAEPAAAAEIKSSVGDKSAERERSGAPASKATAAGKQGAAGLPDLAWCRKFLPINEVVDALGLERRGRAVRCPAHDDSTPSMSIYRNRVRCHAMGCGFAASVVDLVVYVLTGRTEFPDRRSRRAALKAAIAWLRARYPIPCIDPEQRQRWRPGRALMGGYPVDVFIRSGLKAALPGYVADVIEWLAAYADDKGEGDATYRAISRTSGVRSRTRISLSLKVGRRLSILDWERGRKAGGVPSRYRLYLDAARCSEAIARLPEVLGSLLKTGLHSGKKAPNSTLQSPHVGLDSHPVVTDKSGSRPQCGDGVLPQVYGSRPGKEKGD